MENLPQDRLNRPEAHPFAAIVIGGSAGGIAAVSTIVAALPPSFAVPVVVVLHQHPGAIPYWYEYLARHTPLTVVEVEDKLPLRPATIHCAPADYHLLMEADGSFALSVDGKVNYARPSIDLLFASAADAFGPALIGVILTGANEDGARGLAEIAAGGGVAMIQSPATAEWPIMPEAARKAVPQARIVNLEAIATTLVELTATGCLRNETHG